MLLSSDAQCSCHAIAHTRVSTFRMRTFYWEPFAASQGFIREDSDWPREPTSNMSIVDTHHLRKDEQEQPKITPGL